MVNTAPNVIVILGNSRTGKDTIADYLDFEYDYEPVHVLDNFYSFLEDYFGLDCSIRQTVEAKKVVLPGEGGLTVGEMLIEFYHWTHSQGIEWTKNDFSNRTKGIINDTVFTAVRNMHEAEPLIDNSYDHAKGEVRYNVHIFLVTRPGCDGYSSDNKLDQIADYFSDNCDSFTTIINKGTLEELYAIIDEIVYTLGIE